ncbi:MAG: zinc-binding dehydrogenase, partial [Gammaproteobacteria bacterium]|nr:zinc-binding dehydrogenase [Gammaproteobacteria bacterium]
MNTSIQLRSEITSAGTLNLYLEKGTVPEPQDDEVIVRVEAAPINPSDLGIMIGPADISTMQVTGESNNPRVSMDIPEDKLQSLAARHDVAMPVGIEGAGTVVAAGLEAKALLGKVVCISGGGLYSQYRCAKASACLVLNEGVTAIKAASSFVNPMTSLGMVETMRMENHTALVHTAAASNLGQMLVRICNADDVSLVNIVRKKEQVKLLKNLGAKYVCNSSDASFMSDLVSALTATGATIAFDATGGGTLTNQILTAMETAC